MRKGVGMGFQQVPVREDPSRKENTLLHDNYGSHTWHEFTAITLNVSDKRCSALPCFNNLLTLYNTIPTFNGPKEEVL